MIGGGNIRSIGSWKFESFWFYKYFLYVHVQNQKGRKQSTLGWKKKVITDFSNISIFSEHRNYVTSPSVMNDISQLFNAPTHKNGIDLGFLKPWQSVSGIWKSIINEKKKESNEISYNPYSSDYLHITWKENSEYLAIHYVGWKW